MDYLTLIFGLAAFLAACLLDINSSTEMTRYGSKETAPLVSDGKGNFSLWRALIFVIIPPVLVLIVFFTAKNAAGFDRVWAGIFLLPGAALHLFAWWHNRRLIRKAKNGLNGGII